ncbi:MAG TPA: alpha/beta fold hydrolase [Acidimicrobiales bacterium]|nr:alpha/beta fold hydrolase [Acidimicrobiales bacterium]
MAVATISGTAVHYVDVGRGSPPLVLLHAFPLHLGMWDEQVVALSSRWRMILPDLPGFGGTEPLADPGATTIDGFADLVAGLMASLGVGPAVVGGLSMGGYVAFSLLRRHPETVAALVLADTRAGADTPEVIERRNNQQRQVGEEGTDGLVETMVGNLLSDDTKANRPEVVERARALMHGCSPAGVIGALEAMKNRADAVPMLEQVRVPVLVVVGEHDGPSPPDVAAAMADAIPGARLEVVPGAGHLSSLEAPDAFNQVLESFLTRL